MEEGRPQQTRDIFRLASMTKQITSVAAMILYDEGKFRLDDPLGKYLPEDKQSRLVDVYMSTGNGVAISPEPYLYPVKGAKTYFSGGADLSSTAYDYYLFCQMMLNGGELNGVRILKPETVRLMTQTQLETGDYDMGLGFSFLSEKTNTTDARSAGSYSGGGYFGTSYWIDPAENLIAILMVQVYPFDNKGIYRKFEDDVYRGLKALN